MIKHFCFSLLTALTCCLSSAAEPSCAQQMGLQRATLLAKQCLDVSPATHPPCNAANSCPLIIDELTRSCDQIGGESKGLKFCKTVERAGAFQGYLFSGGGTDAVSITVMTDKGERIRAYCMQYCGDLFSEPDENEVVDLRKDRVGRRVAVDVTIERNAGRIPGPDDNDRIALVKRLKLLE